MPQQRSPSSARPRNHDMLVRGVILALIGLILIIAPHFMDATPLRDMFTQGQVVAWFALVLGAAFMLQYWRQYRRTRA